MSETVQPGETITGMRVDIGEMRSDMRHLAETMTAYMERAEDCQRDHETRLRAVETAALAVAQIANIDTRLGAVEDTVAGIATRDKTISWMINGAAGAIGSLVTLIAALLSGRI